MKKISIILTLFFCLNLSAQDILGEWFLHYIEINGNQQYSTIPNSFNNIIFGTNSDFTGTVCSNGYAAAYVINNDSTITVSGFAYFTGFCNYEVEDDLFMRPYFNEFFSLDTVDIFSYEITGSGNNATLMLIHPNGNFAFYGRDPLPENFLPGEWFLHYISDNNVIHNNIFNPNININFELTTGTSFGLPVSGTEICNDYSGVFNLIDPSSLTIFNTTGLNPNTCGSSEENDYESLYNNVLGINSGTFNDLAYTIEGTGINTTLTLTNSVGDYVHYGRQAIATNELVGEWFLYDIWDFDIFLETPITPISIIFSNDTEFGINSIVINGACNTYESTYLTPILESTFECLTPTWSPDSCADNDQGFDIALHNLFSDISGGNFPDVIPIGYTITGTGNEALIQIGQVIFFPDGTPTGVIGSFGRQALSSTEFDLENTMKVFPNPVSDILYISTENNSLENLSYSIYSIDGKKIASSTLLHQSEIDVSQLNSGLYFLNIGSKNKHHKLIKFIKL